MQAARRKPQISKLVAAVACALFILLPAQSVAGQPSLEITVSSQSKDHISVSWTDLGDVLLYFVEIRGNGHYDFTTLNAGTTTHTFGGLKADATYTIKMTAYPESGGALVADIQAQTVAPSPTAAATDTATATPTSTHTATPTTAPAATATLPAFSISVASQSKDHITVAWTDLSAALDYSLTLQPESGSKITATAAAGSTSHTFGSLNSNATYTVSVTARFGDGRTLSASVTTKTEPEATATPTATNTPFSAATPTPTGLSELPAPQNFRVLSGNTVAWDAVAGADRYRIRLDPPVGERILKRVDAPQTQYTFDNLQAGLVYTVRVRAMSDEGSYILMGYLSEARQLIPAAPATATLPAFNISVSKQSKDHITVGWTDLSAALDYSLTLQPESTQAITKTVAAGTSSHTFGGLNSNATYTVSITARFSDGRTLSASVTTKTEPEATATPTATATSTSAQVSLNGSRCELDDAINAANSDAASGSCPAGDGVDTITFHGDVILSGSLSPPSIASDIIIQGGGHTLSRLSKKGMARFRLLNIHSGTVVIHKLTFTKGYVASYGGAIFNNGTLTIDTSTFRDNESSYYGGAIYNGGTLTISNSTFSGNETSHRGGAIHNQGDLTISGSSFSENEASHKGGAIYHGSRNARDEEGFGQWIGVDRAGSLTVKHSSFTKNSVSNTGSAILYVGDLAKLSISGSSFSGNTASHDNGPVWCVAHSRGAQTNAACDSIEYEKVDVSATPAPPTATPVPATATLPAFNISVSKQSKDHITVAWTDLSAALDYTLTLQPESGKKRSKTVAAGRTSHTYGKLNSNATYTVSITARFSDGRTLTASVTTKTEPEATATPSATHAATPTATIAVTPSITVTVSAITQNSVTISWNWNGSPEVRRPPILSLLDFNAKYMVYSKEVSDNSGNDTITNLSPGTRHVYSFTVFPKEGEARVLVLDSGYFNTLAEPTDTPIATATQTALPKLPPPQNLRVLSGNTVAWDAVADADRYRVRLDPPVGERILKRVDSPQTQYTFENLQPGTVYTVRVRSMSDEGSFIWFGDWSQSLSLTAAATATPTPSATPIPPQVSLSASAVTHNSITVNWDWNGSPEVRVPPQIALDDNHNHYGVDARANKGSIVFTDLEPNTLHTYSFTVFPKNGGAGLKLSSGQVRTLSRPTATPIPPTATPIPPTATSLPPIKMTWSIVAVNGKAEAILNWSAVSGVSSYTLQYAGSDLSSGSFSLLASATSQRISGLNPGAVYQVTLTANLQDGSTHTGAAHFTINIPPTDTPIPTNTPVPTATPLPTNTPVPPSPTATPLPSLIQTLIGYRDEQPSSSDHYKRWARALAALGHGSHNNPMTLQEAKNMADKYMRSRWQPVVDALTQLQPPPTNTPVPPPTNTPIPPPTNTPIPPPTNTPIPPPTNTPIPPPTNTPIPPPTNTPIPPPTNTPIQPPTDTPIPPPTDTPVPQSYQVPDSLINKIKDWRKEQASDSDHAIRWTRVLAAFGKDSHSNPMTSSEAKIYRDERGWHRWIEVVTALEKLEGE